MTVISSHLSVAIDYLLDESVFPDERLAGKFLRDGVPMSAEEVREYLREEKAAGKTLFPLKPCDRFDPYEKGCLGHEVEA